MKCLLNQSIIDFSSEIKSLLSKNEKAMNKTTKIINNYTLIEYLIFILFIQNIEGEN